MSSGSMLRSARVVGFFTGFSRILGLTRDMLMSNFFGTSLHMSAFVLAFTIPNLFRRLFGEGALAAAFIPVFVETKTNEGERAAWGLASRILGLLLAVLVGFLLVGWALVAIWMQFETSEFTSLTLALTAIMLPYMVFICLAALAMSMLNSFRHFAVPAFAPCLLNIIWILCILVGFRFIAEDESTRVHFLSWFIVVAGVLQLGVQIPVLVKYGFRGRLSLSLKDEKVKRILLLMGPAALGMAVTQCNVMIDRLIAAAIGTHAPAALFFSERMIYLPLGVFATAIGTVLLPTYSKQAADKNAEELLAMVNKSFRVLCFIMIPASMGLFVLAEPVIRVLLAQGEFGADSIRYTTTALQFYAPGLVVFSLAKIFVPVFYSHQDTRTPVLVGMVCVGINLVLNGLFYFTWPYEIKHAGLACATVISEGVYIVVLMRIFHRRFGSPRWGSMWKALLRFCITTGVMGVSVLYLEALMYDSAMGWAISERLGRIFSVFGSIVIGIVLYFALARLFRFPEWQWITRSSKSEK